MVTAWQHSPDWCHIQWWYYPLTYTWVVDFAAATKQCIAATACVPLGTTTSFKKKDFFSYRGCICLLLALFPVVGIHRHQVLVEFIQLLPTNHCLLVTAQPHLSLCMYFSHCRWTVYQGTKSNLLFPLTRLRERQTLVLGQITTVLPCWSVQCL